jgi:hypothetical protein
MLCSILSLKYVVINSIFIKSEFSLMFPLHNIFLQGTTNPDKENDKGINAALFPNNF